LFERIQALPITALDDQRIGDAVYRLMYDTPAITAAAHRLILTPILAPFGILITTATIALVFPGHQRLVWTALALLPLALVATLPFAGVFRRRGRSSREAGALATATVEEGLSNVLAVQSLGAYGQQRAQFARDSWGSFTRHRALIRSVLYSFFVTALPVSLLLASGFLYVVDQVVDARLTLGDFVLLYTYFVQAAIHALNLGTLWTSVQGSAAGLQRVFDLMDYSGSVAKTEVTALPPIAPSLRVDDVHFDYGDGAAALRGISFSAERGQMITIVGPTGAGKTTLAYMIPRFLEPQRGRVLIDGIDIAAVSLESLRAQIAFVFQEAALFDMTVAENLRQANPDASDEALQRALQRAGAESFVSQLPEGIHTRLGRGGSKLSVGQRQRLSIARAFTRECPLLILDEPTSALDVDTEHELLATLQAARADRLLILITHRLAAARAADMILFLDHGRLIESGDHATLMRKPDGAYRRFVELQVHGV
jgi:ABC-type multidrug transport system fused ATPase/permease subunit